MHDSDEDFTQLDDPAFLAERARPRDHRIADEAVRGAERRVRPARGGEVEGRGRVNAAAEISALPAKAARMLAVEILLADPEALGDDVLEACLYILRERLRTA